MKTKFAVHWAPSVYIIVPGWIFAVAAGAHVGVRPALACGALEHRCCQEHGAAEAGQESLGVHAGLNYAPAAGLRAHAIGTSSGRRERRFRPVETER